MYRPPSCRAQRSREPVRRDARLKIMHRRSGARVLPSRVIGIAACGDHWSDGIGGAAYGKANEEHMSLTPREAQPSHAGPTDAFAARIVGGGRCRTSRRGSAGTAARIAVSCFVEPARRLRSGRPRRRIRRPGDGQGDPDAHHPARRARQGLAGVPQRDGAQPACRAVGRSSLPNERAVHRGRRCAASPSRDVRGPPAHRCRDRGLDRCPVR